MANVSNTSNERIPLSSLFAGGFKRKQWIRYWLSDPVWGLLSFIGHFSLRYVPMRINAWIGRQLGVLAGKIRFKVKSDRARHNLTLLKPHLKDQELDHLIKRMWQNIGQTMCEYSILDKLWAKGRLDVHNDQGIHDCLQRKQAIIFTAAHLGNWEAQASYASDNNLPLLVMYKPVRNRFSRKISEIARKRMNIKMEPTDKYATRKMCKHLAQGKALWLPIDDFKDNQVHTPRFGRKLSLEKTNAAYIVRLAKRYNAAIILVRTKRMDHSEKSLLPLPSLKVVFSDPLQIEDKSDEGVYQFLKQLDKEIESWVLEDPEQWFMLHELRL